MEPPDLQQQFFSFLRKKLPPHLSLVDEVCELLKVGTDSAYRRIRGEKAISLQELKILSEHYQLSLDQVLQLKSNSVVFDAPEINTQFVPFSQYQQGLIKQLTYFNSFKDRKMMYLCKDVPVFHFYVYPEIAAFKSFFWARSILNNPDYNGRKFNLSDSISDENYKQGLEILKAYNEIPSSEIWNYESINSTISQIEYYRDSGIFASRDELQAVYDSFIRMLDHMQLQAEKGHKFLPGSSDLTYRGSYQFYVNEVIIGNNTILVELNDLRASFVSYNVLHYMSTTDPRFTEKAFRNFDTLLSRSAMISVTGERDRNRFFKILREKVEKSMRES